MSNHDPINPIINDQTTKIPAVLDFQCPPNVPAVTQSQISNVFSSQSTNQSLHDGADALLAFFHSEDFCVQSPMVNSPSVTLEPTTVNASSHLSQQFVADAFDSHAHSKIAKTFMGKKLPDCHFQKIKETLQSKGFNAKLHSESIY